MEVENRHFKVAFISHGMAVEPFDLSKLCRLCLKGEEVMCPIFGSIQNGPGATLSHRIMSCAQVKLSEGDGLPSNVCTTCLSQVDRSYQFKLLCEQSDSTLRAAFKTDQQSSDTESLDGGEQWDMTKFTPEVIIKEETEDNNLNGGFVDQPHVAGEYPQLVPPPLYPIASLLAQDPPTVIKQEPASNIDNVNGGNNQLLLARMKQDHSPTNSRSRRCRGGDKLFKCRQCNKSYSFSSALSRHKAVHNTALRPHVCQICNKGFTQVDKLLRHQKTHTMDIFMACDLCQRPFKSYPTYQKHRMAGNCNLGTTKCPQCNADIAEGEVHGCSPGGPASISPSATPIPAHTITTITLSSSSLPSPESAQPQQTPKQPPQQQIQKQPLLQPTQKQPVQPQSKAQQRSSPPPPLQLIQKALEPQPQQSQEDQFPEQSSPEQSPTQNQQSSQQQQIVYEGRKPSGKGRPEFKCGVCLKNFATRGSLDVHSSIHTGVRPFVCSVCDKSFRHKVNLMEHFQRKHSQVRPYICDVCAARFVTKQELVRHYRKHIGD